MLVLLGFLNPLGPFFQTYRMLKKQAASIRTQSSSGIEVIRETNEQLVVQRRRRAVRTFNEALAARPRDALPLRIIEGLCLRRKRIALSFAFIALCFVAGSLGGLCASVVHAGFMSWLSVFTGGCFTCLACLFAMKYEHQIWQIEVGRKRPNEVLGSIREFLRTPGSIIRIFDPRLFEVPHGK